MKITREDTSPQIVTLNIELDSEDVEPYLDRSFKRMVNRVQIPGFRPGKAPRHIVQTYVGKEAMVRESLDLIAQETLDRAIEEQELETFGEPDVELIEADPLSFKAIVPLEPEIDLGDFRSLRMEPEPSEVSEADADLVLERMRYDSAPWQPVDRTVQYGDLVNLNVDGFIEGKRVAEDRGVDFVPNEHNPFPFPGFSENLEGLSKEETREFSLQIPEDYQDQSIAGKEVNFTVTALEIKEKGLPEIDDEFAKGVGEGYESLEALRAKVLEDLTEQAERAALHAFQEKVLEDVINGASVKISDLTTDRETDHLIEERAQASKGRRADVDSYLRDVGKTQEELREELRPAAVERLTRFLIIRKLAQEEDVEVSPEEVDAQIESISSGSPDSRESLRQAFSSETARNSISNAVTTRKVLERLGQIVQGTVEASQEQKEDPSVEPAGEGGEKGESEEETPVSPSEAGQS